MMRGLPFTALPSASLNSIVRRFLKRIAILDDLTVMCKLFYILMLGLIFATRITCAAQEKGGASFRGRYSNYDYAYSLSVPKGVMAFRNHAPFPNHGFGINLSKQQQAYLWVDASYNGLEWKSFDDAIRSSVDFVKNNGVTNIKLAKQSKTYLSKLHAVHFLIKYDVFGKSMVQETVLAFRLEKNKEEIVYSINLTTPVKRYKRDSILVAKLQRTWKLKKQP